MPAANPTKLGIGLLLMAVMGCPAFCAGSEDPAAGWTALMTSAGKACEQGNYQIAERDWRLALEEADKFAPFDIRKAKTLNNLAIVLAESGKYEDAEPLAKKSLEIREKFSDMSDPSMVQDLVRGLSTLAMVYDYEHKYADAEPLYKRALAIQEKAEGMGSLAGDILVNLAQHRLETGKALEAEADLKRALQIYERSGEEKDRAIALRKLSLVYIAENRPTEAIALAKYALESARKLLPAVHPEMPPYLDVLAEAYLKAGNYKQSASSFQEELALRRRLSGSDSPESKTVATKLSDAERRLKETNGGTRR